MGFFECKSSLDVPVSVICMADAEDMYRITYVQGVSYTVHMDDRDLVFHSRDKFYVGDMRAWESNKQTTRKRGTCRRFWEKRMNKNNGILMRYLNILVDGGRFLLG